MILIETDLLLAAISLEDKHNAEATAILDKFEGKIGLSPYSIIEIDLLLRSESLKVLNIKEFHRLLDSFTEYQGIRILPLKPLYHAEAYRLREKYKLTYFDSLHASIGIIENLELVSFDKTYKAVSNLKYKHPSQLLKR